MAMGGGKVDPGSIPTSTRGTRRFDPNTGYTGGMTPEMFATDGDYARYAQAQGARAGSATGNAVDPSTGLSHPYATNPSMSTDIYSTAPGAVGGINTVVKGQGTVSQPSFETQQQAQLDAQLGEHGMTTKAKLDAEAAASNAKLQADAESRRLGYLSTIQGTQSPQVGAQGGPAFDENAARTAAFARAKEQAGATAVSSLKALTDVMAERGLTGSSVEGNEVANIVGQGAGRVNDYMRTQLMTDLNRSADIADRNQAGAIQQRGQNMSMMPSLMGLITAGRGVY